MPVSTPMAYSWVFILLLSKGQEGGQRLPVRVRATPALGDACAARERATYAPPANGICRVSSPSKAVYR